MSELNRRLLDAFCRGNATDFNEVLNEVSKLEIQIAEARKGAKKFCDEQCEEGPGWGECKECGCWVFTIREALGMEVFKK